MLLLHVQPDSEPYRGESEGFVSFCRTKPSLSFKISQHKGPHYSLTVPSLTASPESIQREYCWVERWEEEWKEEGVGCDQQRLPGTAGQPAGTVQPRQEGEQPP